MHTTTIPYWYGAHTTIPYWYGTHIAIHVLPRLVVPLKVCYSCTNDNSHCCLKNMYVSAELVQQTSCWPHSSRCFQLNELAGVWKH